MFLSLFLGYLSVFRYSLYFIYYFKVYKTYL
nr:MAG TPA: hypothetical protein [Caudoviricetes sp.]